MTDPYSPFTLGNAVAGAPSALAGGELSRYAETSALTDELVRIARNGGDTTPLTDELVRMARAALPEVTRDMPAEVVYGSVMETQNTLGQLAAVAPIAAGVLQTLHRGGSTEQAAAQVAPEALKAMGVPIPDSLAEVADPGLPGAGSAVGIDSPTGSLLSKASDAAGLDGAASAAGFDPATAIAGGRDRPGGLARTPDFAGSAASVVPSAAPGFQPEALSPGAGFDGASAGIGGIGDTGGFASASLPDVSGVASSSFDPGAALSDVASSLSDRLPSAFKTGVDRGLSLSPQARIARPDSPLAQAAAALGLSDQPRLLQIDTALPGAFLVERAHGHESLCDDGFRFDIDCLALSAFLDPRALIGQPVDLRLRRPDGSYRHWRGLCTQAAPLGGDGGYARYRLTLEPWLALLKLRRNALIFQDLDLQGILARVFDDYPLADWRFDVTQALPVRPITTQYRETDFAFVTRLLAEAGLAWRFEHAQDDVPAGESGHTLVVFDRQAELPTAEPATVRFHRSNLTEQEDALTRFSEQRQAVPDALTTASWQAEQVEAVSARVEAAPAGPHLPGREVYRMPRAGRFALREQAQLEAELQLDALRLPQRLHAGAGSVRGLAAGHAFTLTQHPDLSGQVFVPLRIEHVATNNLGAGMVALLDDPGLERGSYRNGFLAVPQGTPLVPRSPDRPQLTGLQTARVVGLPDAALTVTRDHQIRLQFPWQRGTAPNAGGLTETGSRTAPEGHAPGNETSGTWVRVAEWLAGPNWGSHALPRIGAEVLVEFLHGDIDQPLVTGQLYNGEVAPPFAAGIDASNHIGTLSGLHTQSHDGGGTQQWVIDDAPGQLRQRLHTSLADSRLELGYLVDHSNGQRGALRGQGFDLATLGWSNLRAAQGVLLSTTARANAVSTQFDVREAVAQLKGAEKTAQALDDAATQNQVPGLTGNARQTAFVALVDPEQQGKYAGAVNGQAATKPSGEARDGGDPVERFARPLLLAETPDTFAAATPMSALAYAGGHSHLTVQDDAHFAAGQTYAAVSGAHTALFAQQGPIRAIAANGPVTMQAHVGELELLADQSVTVTATDERIDVLAQQKIVLQAGQTQVTLEGANITFACPGEFTVKAGMHPFKPGEGGTAPLPSLPRGQTKLKGRYPFSV